MKEAILKKIRESNLPVVICGAGIVGGELFDILENENIEVDAFCDNSTKVAGTEFKNRKVLYMPELKNYYTDAIFLISIAAIKDVVELLEDMGFKDWYSCKYFIADLNYSMYDENRRLNYKKFSLDSCVHCHDGFLNQEKLFIRSIDLIITEKCSLRCKDCSNLMQYYEKPKNCDLEYIYKQIDVFCEYVDEVMEFRLIGGDVFMNKEWPLVVEKLIPIEKVKRIVLYTNGTLVPKEESLNVLQNEKVFVVISDYKELSINLEKLKKLFVEYKITHNVLEIDEWLDCSSISKHGRTAEENNEIFKLCCAKNMLTLSDGKIFRCPYAANANRLKAVPDYTTDYVNIIELFENDVDKKTVIKKIKEYIDRTVYLETCDFCSGRPLYGKVVKPAVQIKKPIFYEKFDINKSEDKSCLTKN